MSEIISKKDEAALGIYLGFTNSYVGIFVDNTVKVLGNVAKNSGSPQKDTDDIASMNIQKLKEIAEDNLGYAVQNAVIAVPSYFSDNQREALKKAGTKAELNILRIINQPTAAVISYNFDNYESKEKHILVFHLGGRTVETTILCVEEGIFENKGREGNAYLGGQNFDEILVDYCVDAYFKETKINIKENTLAMKLLMPACEKAKIELSTSEFASIEIDQSSGFLLKIQRSTLEELCLPIFKECISLIERAITNANLDPLQIDEIILSGASTKIPKIIELITAFFNGKTPIKQSINPEECVAYGAAIQAAIFINICPLRQGDLIIDDVTVLPLGIETFDKLMKVIIPRGMYIPGRKSITVTTAQDYQTSIGISIFEGLRIYSKDNQLLGKFYLNGITSQLKGIPQVTVMLEVDANGTLHVSAEEMDTLNSKKIQIVREYRYSVEDIYRLVSEAENCEQEDEEINNDHEETCRLLNYSFEIMKYMSDKEFKGRLINNEEQMIQEILDKVNNLWMGFQGAQSQTTSMLTELKNKLKEFENIVNPIVLRLKSTGQIFEINNSLIEPLWEWHEEKQVGDN